MGIIDILSGMMQSKLKARDLETINPKDPSLPGYIDQVRQVVNKTNKSHLYFANLLEIARQYEESEQEHLKAVENKEKYAVKHYALFLYGRNRSTEAEAYCQELLDAAEELPQTTLIMAMIKKSLKENEDAEYYFQKAIEMGNHKAKAWYFNFLAFRHENIDDKLETLSKDILEDKKISKQEYAMIKFAYANYYDTQALDMYIEDKKNGVYNEERSQRRLELNQLALKWYERAKEDGHRQAPNDVEAKERFLKAGGEFEQGEAELKRLYSK